MAPPVNLITIAIAAGIGLGTALYYFITYLSEENALRNRIALPSNNSRSLSYSPPSQRLSQPHSRFQLPSQVSSVAREVPSSSTSNSGARRRETRPVENCYICANPLGTDTLGLGCGHKFDRECYTIVDQMLKAFGVSSKCPQCVTNLLFE